MNKNKPGDLSPDLTWQEKLLKIRNKLPVEVTSYKAENRNSRKRKLKFTLDEASLQLNIKPKILLAFLKRINMQPITTRIDQRLKAASYVMLIKKFNYNLYLEDQTRFDEILRQQKESDKKKKESDKKKLLNTFFPKIKKGFTTDNSVDRPTWNFKAVTEPLLLNVSWANVLFEDYMIKIKYETHYSLPYTVPDSRKSFKFLRKYILNLGLEPLQVVLAENKILEIKNLNQLNDIVTILKVKQEVIDEFEKGRAVSVKSILNHVRNLPTTFLLQVAKAAAEEVRCIDYLANKQDERFKPIPAFEIIPNGRSVATEDTFIFTLNHNSSLFLVWESTVHGRATYVFTTNIEGYEEVVQSIYDYIASQQKAKRMKLRKKDANLSELNYLTFVTHSSFEHWQEKLNNTIFECRTQ